MVHSTINRVLLFIFLHTICVPSGVYANACEPNESKAHPYDCSSFYLCDAEGVPHPFSCPPGLHFNSLNSCCDWPENAKCYDFKISKNFEDKIEGKENDDVEQIDSFNIKEYPKYETLSKDTNENSEEHLHSTDDFHRNDEETRYSTEDEHLMMKRDESDQESNLKEEDGENYSLTDSKSSAETHDSEVEGKYEVYYNTPHDTMIQMNISEVDEKLISLIHMLIQFSYSLENDFVDPLEYDKSDSISGNNSLSEINEEEDPHKPDTYEDQFESEQNEGNQEMEISEAERE